MSTRRERASVTSRSSVLNWVWPVCVIAFMSPMVLTGQTETPTTTKAASGATAQPRTFATPQEAADALIDAAEKFDVAALDQMFGSAGSDIIFTGETPRDRELAAAFAAEARKEKSVVVDPQHKDRAILVIGNDDWPFAPPLVRKAGKWSFDAVAGREELLYRRIGSNELDAIEICRGYVEAQHEYALEKHDGSRVNQYAQRIVSTPGKRDGLAWQNPDGKWDGPVGEKIAKIIEKGYTGPPEPYHGYFFKILKGQGPAAPLGEMDFLVKGVMIGGFALVAAPAEHGVTGVKTFIVSHDGIVYEKDLGPGTLDSFKAMERYNPDKSWNVSK
ncbi:MAG: DUF2950 domain-containing protein [Acidobacteria bacterium]|nr:MAG: DUF2950 domain-containing protein [Acidobacteriota bacterium]